jgi:hypothetical protein
MGGCQSHRAPDGVHLKMKIGVCTHETLDKVLTESVSPLGVDPTLDQPMLTYRTRINHTKNSSSSRPEPDGCRCDERLNTQTEAGVRLTYTGLCG